MWMLLLFLPMMLMSGEWAEKVLSSMTLEEKVGQLFVVPGCAARGDDHRADWDRLLEDMHIGGMWLRGAASMEQVQFLNALQTQSKWPLLVAIDDEWGVAQRTTDAIAFPRNGEIRRRESLYSMGQEIGQQARRLGAHLNLAPVADVNTNPNNPIIGTRAFGSNAEEVAECVVDVVQGLQSAGTLACVKHFPGHGDTELDSHWALPTLSHFWERLSEVELVPFQRVIDAGVDAVMVGHLLVPCVDAELPATFSREMIHTLLKQKMGFQGLVVSDALNMRALDRYSPEEIALLARRAGIDLLLYAAAPAPVVDHLVREVVPRSVRALLTAYREGELALEDLDQSVRKILEAKERLGLAEERSVAVEGVVEFLHRPEVVELDMLLRS